MRDPCPAGISGNHVPVIIFIRGWTKQKTKKKLGDVNKKIDRDNNNNDTHTQHQIIIKIITNDVDGHTHMYTCIELFEFTLLPRE
jgi:hypothetical protein